VLEAKSRRPVTHQTKRKKRNKSITLTKNLKKFFKSSKRSKNAKDSFFNLLKYRLWRELKIDLCYIERKFIKKHIYRKPEELFTKMINRNYNVQKKIKFWHFSNLSNQLKYKPKLNPTLKKTFSRKKSRKLSHKSKTQENFFKVKNLKQKKERGKNSRMKSIKNNSVTKKSKLMLPFALVMDQRKKNQRRRMIKTSHTQKRRVIEHIYYKDASAHTNMSKTQYQRKKRYYKGSFQNSRIIPQKIHLNLQRGRNRRKTKKSKKKSVR